MKKYWRLLIALVLTTFLVITVPGFVHSQNTSTPNNNIDKAVVILDNETLFPIQVNSGSISPEQRAQAITDKIENFAKDTSISIDSLLIGDQAGMTVIFSGDTVIATISEADAKSAKTTPHKLAATYIQKLKDSVSRYRKKYSLSNNSVELGTWQWLQHFFQNISSLTAQNKQVSYTRGFLYALIATAILIFILFVLNITFPRIYSKLNYRENPSIPGIKFRNFQMLSARQVSKILLSLTQFFQFIITLGFISIYTVLVLSSFPWTKKIGGEIWVYFTSAINQVGIAILKYIPNLFILALIIFISYSVLRLLNSIFSELGKGTIALPGFYPEWAQPTNKIMGFLVIAITAVICFPYFPGFGSSSFKGISVVLGVIVSIGSRTAVANVVSGIILIYTRSFQIGDRIQIGDFSTRKYVKGDVEEKSIFVTRIRTSHNVLITIPNSQLLSGNILNYSASMRETNRPVALTTIVNFGYDIPWQKVYDVLTEAASITSYVLEEPAPVVLQANLDAYSVSYELRAYTHHPSKESRLRSELHQNIRDKCNAARIEILSPEYSAVRDGNTSTIPKDYLPENYTPAGFQLNSLGNLFQLDLKLGSERKNGNGKKPDTPNPSMEVKSSNKNTRP